mmetsp:Transcript_3961/g.9712  ORF Transcript_3961/g.9712 Transcript_3961/m.9712 type:complete len:478 (+) Transcript_3961:293-1726(+)
MDVEIIGEKNFKLKIGQSVFLIGILKIQNFISKKEKNSNFFRNIFNFNILVQNIKIIPNYFKNFWSKKFLTKSEYFFLNRLNHYINLFNICVKSVDFLPKNHDGCKAAILIILGSKKEKKDSFICCFVSGEKFSKKNAFLSKISSDGFFFQQKQKKSLNNYIERDPKGKIISKIFEKTQRNFFYQSKIIENENSLFEWLENFKNLRFGERKNKNFPKLIFIELRLRKNFLNLNNILFSEFFFDRKFYSLFDFFYILPESTFSNESFFVPKKIKKIVKSETKNDFSKKIFRKKCLFLKIIKKKLSSYILRRYIKYIQMCFSPFFSDEAKNLTINYYVFFKKFKKKFYFLAPLFPLETIILFSETHAKIDFKKSVTQNDVINAIEILSDSKVYNKKLLENFTFKKGSRILKKISYIKKLLEIIKTIFFQKKRTLFSLKDLIEKFHLKTPFFILEEIIEILFKYGLIKRIGKNFFQILPF